MCVKWICISDERWRYNLKTKIAQWQVCVCIVIVCLCTSLLYRIESLLGLAHSYFCKMRIVEVTGTRDVCRGGTQMAESKCRN